MKKARLRIGRVPQQTSLVKRAISTTMLVVTLFVLSSCGSKSKYETAVFTVAGNTLTIPLEKFEEGQGEATKLLTRDGMSIYTSSFLTSVIKSETDPDLAFDYAKSVTDREGSLSNYEEEGFTPIGNPNYREDFDKVIIIQNNHAVILPVLYWYEFNGEQLQILTPWKLAILGSNYNMILIEDGHSTAKAYDFAKKLVGAKGKVTDYALDYSVEKGNKKTWDSTWGFNKAITLGDYYNTILVIDKWKDYSDSEKFQLKLKDSGVIFASAFNTLLISEQSNDGVGATEIATALSDNVHDLTKRIDSTMVTNAQAAKFTDNFQNVIITNDSSTVLPLKEWNTYSGEKFKLGLNNGVTILTTSKDSRLMSHTDDEIKANDLARGLSTNVINPDPKYEISKNNSIPWMWDNMYTFPYALEVRDDSILILSVEYWGERPGGDQLQIIIAGANTPYQTTFYDTKLVNLGNSNCTIQEVAQWFNDGTKNIVDLTSHVEGKGILDSSRNVSDFNYAIAVNGDVASIIPIDGWEDGDGTKSDETYTHFSEKIKLKLSSDNSIAGDNTNINLVRTDDRELLDYLAHGLISSEGTINKPYEKELIYDKK